MKEGKLPENIYKRSVLKLLSKSFNNSGDFVMSVKSGVVLQNDWIEVIINHAINDTVAQKAICTGVTAGMILPVDEEEKSIKIMSNIINDTLMKAQLPLLDLNICVSETVERPVINVACLGIKQENIEDSEGFVCNKLDECDIVMIGNAGAAAAAFLADECAVLLTETLPQELVDTASAWKKYMYGKKKVAVAVNAGAMALYETGEGGVFGAAWEFADKLNCGLEIYLDRIPIMQETVEICEVFDLNPYMLDSCGSFLIAVDNAAEFMDKLESAGIKAYNIGRFTKNNDRVVYSGEEKRFLTPAQPDEIYKVKMGK